MLRLRNAGNGPCRAGAGLTGRVSGEDATGLPGAGARPEQVLSGRSLAGVEAVFRDVVGQLVQQRWADAALAVAFEDLAPVAGFPVVPGRRWGPGL